MKLEYKPSQDEVIVEISPLPKQPPFSIKEIKIWGDEKHLISRIAISGFRSFQERMLKEFGIIKLGGLWRNVSISDADIERSRQELLAQLEEQW